MQYENLYRFTAKIPLPLGVPLQCKACISGGTGWQGNCMQQLDWMMKQSGGDALVVDTAWQDMQQCQTRNGATN